MTLKLRRIHQSLLFGVLIIIQVLSGCQSVSDPVTPTQQDSQFDFLLEQIASHQEQNQLVGAEILILRKDSVEVHEVIGWSNRETDQPLEKNSIYRIRSLSKPVIATAILMLLEEGKLDLDDPVHHYIRSFNNPKSNSITIRQCLTHTSGLGNHDWQNIGLSKPVSEFETLRELVDEIGLNGPFTKQGMYRYSDSGYASLTEIIAVITGRPAEDFVQQRIFDPLGMKNSHTHFEPGVDWAEQLNPTYRWADSTNNFAEYWNNQQEQEYQFFRGHGGIYSTASDYAAFVSMWLNDGRHGDKQILSQQIIRQAFAATLEMPKAAPRSHQGLAWMHLNHDTATNALSYFTHAGSDGTVIHAYPNEGTVAIYFTQSRSHPLFLFQDLITLTPPYDQYRKWNYNNQYLDQWKEILTRSENGTDGSMTDSPYTGKYRCLTNQAFNSEITVEQGQLEQSVRRS